MSSILIWRELSEWIISNDMEKADEAKKRIEERQRSRIKQSEENNQHHQCRYFVYQSESQLHEIAPSIPDIAGLFPTPGRKKLEQNSSSSSSSSSSVG